MIINEPQLAAHASKTVKKLWGVEYWITNEEFYCLKFLKVIPGYQCSIHAHKKKDETFFGISGTLRLTIHKGDGAPFEEHAIHAGRTYRVRKGVFHSFQAHNECWIAEISTHHDEKDVTRLAESRKLQP